MFVRIVFWSYERGSVPYDLMVIAILLFVLATPRKWFHDQPNLILRPVSGQIRLVSMDPATNTELFRVDSSLLDPGLRPPALESAAHGLLGRSVTSLSGTTFQIVAIEPVTSQGQVVAYNVTIKPASGVRQ